jgi:Phosphate transporter family
VEITAMATIGAADWFGLPVSTTHVLSSGIAGTMAANHTGLQWATVRNSANGLGADPTGVDDVGGLPVLGVSEYLLM